MYNPWWHNREINEYMQMARRERIRKELEEPKKLTEEEVREKLCELKALLDSFKGQTIPRNLIPLMKDLHEALKEGGYFRFKMKSRKKNGIMERLRRLF